MFKKELDETRFDVKRFLITTLFTAITVALLIFFKEEDSGAAVMLVLEILFGANALLVIFTAGDEFKKWRDRRVVEADIQAILARK